MWVLTTCSSNVNSSKDPFNGLYIFQVTLTWDATMSDIYLTEEDCSSIMDISTNMCLVIINISS